MRLSLALLALLAVGCTYPVVVETSTRIADGSEVTVATDGDASGSTDIADGDAPGTDDTRSASQPLSDAMPADGTSSAKADEDEGAAGRAGDGRPATKTMTLMAEGEPYSQPVKLAAFPDFPIPFSTYIHDDMNVEQPGSGDAASLEWSSGRVLVNWAREGDAAATIARIRANIPGAEPFPAHWASAAFAYQAGGAVGTVYVVQRGGTVITIEASSSVEGAEGTVNVEEVVLGEWQWADGSSLRADTPRGR